MNHEINLEKYNIRTDLAIEAIANVEDEKGIKSEIENFNDIKVTNVYLNKKGGKKIGKKEGIYITIEFDDITDYHNRKEVLEVFATKLKELIKYLKIGEDALGLIIGLGNDKSTPDSLGPLVINNVIVTNHLYLINSLDEGFRRICAFNPGVMGTTGIETSDLVLSVIEKIKPDFVIVIDALASQSIERLNKTIQMTDTGIHPGSGVGNNRKEISKDILNVPVIAIGVPTVVDAVTIVSDTLNYMHKHFSYFKENIDNPVNKLISASQINYLKDDIKVSQKDKEELLGIVGNLEEPEVKQLIFEVLTPIGYNLMVTPKEVDFIILKLGELISEGINRSLHKNVDNL